MTSLLYNVLSGIYGTLSIILTIALGIGLPFASTNLSLIIILFIFLSITTSNVIYKGYFDDTFIYLGAAILSINPLALTVALSYKF